MAFPLTHLLVADLMLKRNPMPQPGLFLLGSIAPDAVHTRACFQSAEMSGIGAAKKITHLCPISDERWGQVTDNKGWENCVRAFLRNHKDDCLCMGYATHVLTDIFNNSGLWHRFRTSYPLEAAKGYASDYYRDLRNIDARLYHCVFKNSGIEATLAGSIARDIPGLVAADEIHAIRDVLLYQQYKNIGEDVSEEYTYVTYDQVLAFINDAADYCAGVLK